MNRDPVFITLSVVAAAAALYLLLRWGVRLWFTEKEKHLDRVLKKMEKK